MALDAQRLEDNYVKKFTSIGGEPDGEHAWFRKLAKLLAEETVNEIQQNSEVIIKTGSSAGSYKVN